MNATTREPTMPDGVSHAHGPALPPDTDRADRAAMLRSYRLTRSALPPVLPTRMPPQQFEFWTPPFVEAFRQWKQRLLRRPVLPGAVDLGRS